MLYVVYIFIINNSISEANIYIYTHTHPHTHTVHDFFISFLPKSPAPRGTARSKILLFFSFFFSLLFFFFSFDLFCLDYKEKKVLKYIYIYIYMYMYVCITQE